MEELLGILEAAKMAGKVLGYAYPFGQEIGKWASPAQKPSVEGDTINEIITVTDLLSKGIMDPFSLPGLDKIFGTTDKPKPKPKPKPEPETLKPEDIEITTVDPGTIVPETTTPTVSFPYEMGLLPASQYFIPEYDDVLADEVITGLPKESFKIEDLDIDSELENAMTIWESDSGGVNEIKDLILEEHIDRSNVLDMIAPELETDIPKTLTTFADPIERDNSISEFLNLFRDNKQSILNTLALPKAMESIYNDEQLTEHTKQIVTKAKPQLKADLVEYEILGNQIETGLKELDVLKNKRGLSDEQRSSVKNQIMNQENVINKMLTVFRETNNKVEKDIEKVKKNIKSKPVDQLEKEFLKEARIPTKFDSTGLKEIDMGSTKRGIGSEGFSDTRNYESRCGLQPINICIKNKIV